jgi:hypothetical protein
LGGFFVEVVAPNSCNFSSFCEQLPLNKGVESSIEATPNVTEIPPFEDVGRKIEIECAQAGSEHATIGLGEQHRHSAAEAGQAIAVRLGELFNQPFALEPT